MFLERINCSNRGDPPHQFLTAYTQKVAGYVRCQKGLEKFRNCRFQSFGMNGAVNAPFINIHPFLRSSALYIWCVNVTWPGGQSCNLHNKSRLLYISQELLFHDLSPLLVPYLILETARNHPSFATSKPPGLNKTQSLERLILSFLGFAVKRTIWKCTIRLLSSGVNNAY